jgi:hypothetical protein
MADENDQGPIAVDLPPKIREYLNEIAEIYGEPPSATARSLLSQVLIERAVTYGLRPNHHERDK